MVCWCSKLFGWNQTLYYWFILLCVLKWIFERIFTVKGLSKREEMRKRRGEMNREVFLCHISVFQDPLTAQLLFSYMGHRFVGKLKKAEDLSFKKKEFTRAWFCLHVTLRKSLNLFMLLLLHHNFVTICSCLSKEGIRYDYFTVQLFCQWEMSWGKLGTNHSDGTSQDVVIM